jgi:hypothetical protein
MEDLQQLSPQAIDRFREIYREEFGEEISDGQAQEIGLRLLRLFDMLSESPPTKNKQKRARPHSTH